MAENFILTLADPPSKETVSFDGALSAFLADVERRGRSKTTLDSYRWQLEPYVRALRENGMDPATVAEAWIRGYLESRKSGGLKPASLCLALVAIRQFHAFLRRSGLCRRDPARRINPPTPKSRIPQILNVREVKAILAHLCGGRYRNIRTKAMITLMYATGVRASELTGLLEKDIDLESGLVRVLGKGGRVRVVPFPKDVAGVVAEYMAEKNSRFPGNPRVFLNFQGKPLSRCAVWAEVKDVAKRAGISKPVSPVILRHTFATHLMWGGADLRSIQDLLGHQKLGTTEIYTQLDDGHVRKTYHQAHPLANGKMGVPHG